MTKLLRVPVTSLQVGEQLLEGATARYVARVHRVQPGEQIELFDPERAVVATAIVQSTGKDHVTVLVGNIRNSRRSKLSVTLLQGLGKGTKPEQVLRDATALGVQRLVMLETERAATKIPEKKHGARKERWLRIAVETARQSGRGDLPEVEGPIALVEALRAVDADHRLVLVPGAPPLWGRLLPFEPSASIAVLIGPEGGLSSEEIASAERVGFQPASLGENVLRTELAAAAVLGALVAWAARPKSPA